RRLSGAFKGWRMTSPPDDDDELTSEEPDLTGAGDDVGDASSSLTDDDKGAAPPPTPTAGALAAPYPDGFNDSDLTSSMPDIASIPTREEVDACRDGFQFTEGEIRSGIDGFRPLLRAVGFSDDETNEYYGIQSDDGILRSQFAPRENWQGTNAMPPFDDYWTS